LFYLNLLQLIRIRRLHRNSTLSKIDYVTLHTRRHSSNSTDIQTQRPLVCLLKLYYLTLDGDTKIRDPAQSAKKCITHISGLP